MAELGRQRVVSRCHHRRGQVSGSGRWCRWVLGRGVEGQTHWGCLLLFIYLIFLKGATLSWISPAVDFGSIQPHSAFSEANFTSKAELEVILSIFVLPLVSLCLFLNPAPFTVIQRSWKDLDLLCSVQENPNSNTISPSPSAGPSNFGSSSLTWKET